MKETVQKYLPSQHDPLRMLRVAAALAIIVYSYDILHGLLILVSPSVLGENVAAYYTGALANTAAAQNVRTTIAVSLILTIALSLMEVRGGIHGLRGHATRSEVIICLAVALYCLGTIIYTAVTEGPELEAMVEFGISLLVALGLAYCGHRTLKQHGSHASSATIADYRAGLTVNGALLMAFSIFSLVQGILGIFMPSLLGIPDELLQSASADSLQSTIAIIATESIVLSLIQLRLGWLAYRKQPTTWSIRLDALFFLVSALGFASILIWGNADLSLSDFSDFACTGVLLLCWVYSRKTLS